MGFGVKAFKPCAVALTFQVARLPHIGANAARLEIAPANRFNPRGGVLGQECAKFLREIEQHRPALEHANIARLCVVDNRRNTAIGINQKIVWLFMLTLA